MWHAIGRQDMVWEVRDMDSQRRGACEVSVLERDIEGTVGAKFMLRSAGAFAMMFQTLLLRLLKKAALLEKDWLGHLLQTRAKAGIKGGLRANDEDPALSLIATGGEVRGLHVRRRTGRTLAADPALWAPLAHY